MKVVRQSLLTHLDTSGIPASTLMYFRAVGNGVLGDGAGDFQATSFGSAFLNVVPEPTTAALVGCGLLAMSVIGRRYSNRS
jgi:hypothetical protein